MLRGAADAWEVPRDLALGRYPSFVTGGPLRRGEIPVFVFHGAEPESFSRRLDHLDRNGYRTLSADEYLAILRQQRQAPERAVLLTFDDGRGSFWSVAAPLLSRRGMRAAVFLVPGRMASRSALGPTIDSAPDVRPADLLREHGEQALLCWEEVESLAASGLFDFQSHSLLHARVHTAARLAGFVTPWSRQGYAAFDQPLLQSSRGDLLGAEAPLGAPLLESSPRLAEAPRFFEAPEARACCVAMVEAQGGPAFFERSDWQRRLTAIFDRSALRGRVETREEQLAALRRELLESRDLIEQHTGRRVIHLCYPWHAAGPTARSLAREAGYQTAFCGKVRGTPITLPGMDPAAIARIGEDYLELLPGRGRRTLGEVLRDKWRRRFGAGPSRARERG